MSIVIKQSDSKQSASAASSLSALPDNIRQAAATVPWLVNHPRRPEFLSYIREGIPQGEFQNIVYSSPSFLTFLMIACGDRDQAYELLLDVAAQGVDPRRATNRRSRLRSTLHHFWPATICDDLLRAVAAGMVFELHRMFEPLIHARLIDKIMLSGGASKALAFQQLIAALFDPLPVWRFEQEELISARGCLAAFGPVATDIPTLEIQPSLEHSPSCATP